MRTPVLILLAAFAVGLLGLACVDLLGRRAADHSTTGSGSVEHPETRNETSIDAGGDAEVHNTTWNVTGGLGGMFGLACVGWFGAWRRGRRESRALDTVTDAIEEAHCEDCKARIRSRGDAHLAKRVQRRYHKDRKRSA